MTTTGLTHLTALSGKRLTATRMGRYTCPPELKLHVMFLFLHIRRLTSNVSLVLLSPDTIRASLRPVLRSSRRPRVPSGVANLQRGWVETMVKKLQLAQAFDSWECSGAR